MHVCVCVGGWGGRGGLREHVCMQACVCEREREIEPVCLCVYACMFVSVCVCV